MRILGSFVVLSVLAFSPATHGASTLFKPGTAFKDCSDCPEMVVLPRQAFVMGSPASEVGRSANEAQRKVTISYPLAVAKFEVTFEQWEACLADGGCGGHYPRDEGRGRGTMPVTDVNWFHAQTYVKWLSQKTGAKYRLLTEAEWEYAARAGADTAYAWGDTASHMHANYGSDECCNGFTSGSDQWELSAPVGSFPANRFGLHDLSGNLWEWVEDCWAESPAAGPVDGSARLMPGCELRVMRGGSWASMPVKIRAAHRDPNHPADRAEFIGFRVARTD